MPRPPSSSAARSRVGPLLMALITALALSSCGGGSDFDEPTSELDQLEAAHGGADGLRQFFETHGEAEIAAELAGTASATRSMSRSA
jgi:hypothetical protein